MSDSYRPGASAFLPDDVSIACWFFVLTLLSLDYSIFLVRGRHLPGGLSPRIIQITIDETLGGLNVFTTVAHHPRGTTG